MKRKNKEIIFVSCGQVGLRNSKINWPDANFRGNTILRVIYDIDYENLRVQLDGEEGAWLSNSEFPHGVGFYERI